jgi:hypothetical protein
LDLLQGPWIFASQLSPSDSSGLSGHQRNPHHEHIFVAISFANAFFSHQLYDEMASVSTWLFNLSNSFNVTEKRLLAGRMVGNLINAMDDMIAYLNVTENPSTPSPTAPPIPTDLPPIKFMHYSAHDSTVLPMLVALEVFDGVWPPYASHVVLELRQSNDDGSFFVRAFYQDVLLTLPFCNGKQVCFQILMICYS